MSHNYGCSYLLNLEPLVLNLLYIRGPILLSKPVPVLLTKLIWAGPERQYKATWRLTEVFVGHFSIFSLL